MYGNEKAARGMCSYFPPRILTPTHEGILRAFASDARRWAVAGIDFRVIWQRPELGFDAALQLLK